MTANTEAQRRLHRSLVSRDADRIIAIAQAHGALGWKVNGAGGEGGSLTLLCGDRSTMKRTMIREIEAEDGRFRSIPVYLSRHGLRLWEAPGRLDQAQHPRER
jgi:D-glycero-alpha-D-manno-heptose-7-phosphate kinase